MIKADFLRTYHGKNLPFFQELRAKQPEALEEVTITYEDVVRRTHVEKILSISHRWSLPTQPDPAGDQLKAIKVFLDSSKGKQFKLVWIDSGSMPQGKSVGLHLSSEEKADMKSMLSQVNMLYLGTTVLILLDMSYMSRFWTQFEAWLSMQFATPKGLKSAVGTDNARYHIVCITNAVEQAEAQTKILVDTWANKTPLEAFDFLSKDDVTVTNQSDKEGQLPKIKALDATVQGVIEDIGARLKQLVAVSARDLEWAKAALQKGKRECQEAKARADAVCQAAKEEAEADCRAAKEQAEADVVLLEEAVTMAELKAKEAREAKEEHVQATAHGAMPMDREGRRIDIEEEAPKSEKEGGNLSLADKAAIQQVIKDAMAACPEGHIRHVSEVQVNVKGGVKMTTLVIHDKNRKSGLESTKTETFEEKDLRC
jgi:hypothetical protein